MSTPLYSSPSSLPQTGIADTSQREKAWDIWPYPCIGGFRFVDLNLCTTAQYPEILERLKHGEKLLDLGCCFGQEMRKLILDGAPPENLFGTDLRQDFFDLGYDLFLDRETFKSTFIAADIFEPSPQLEAVNGKVSFVYAGAFFHLFDRPEQLQIAKRMASLLSTQPGSMVLGRQVGNVNPGRYEHKTNSDGFMFRHDEQSWKELWEEAGRETDTKWDVWVELVMRSRFMVPGQNQTGARQMNFCVKRV